MAGEAKAGDWEKLKQVMGDFDARLHRNAQKALRRAGEELASDIRTRILDGKDMKPLHGFTIEQKGSSKPLIDDGDLLGSVGMRFIEELAVFIGVHRRAEDGTDIAAVHEREDGTRVPVTPKMRAFLHSRGFHLRPETTELFIPGRPFVKPAYRDFRERKSAERFAVELVEETLRGKG
jgi:hypothetical protein